MKIENTKAEKSIQADLGQGFATYALVRGQWYSVNLWPDGTICDVRWRATVRERDQIISILVRRNRL